MDLSHMFSHNTEAPGEEEEAVLLPVRRRGRKGIHTTATVKFNAYDRTFHSRHAFVTFPDEAEVPYSLNKAKRWQQVEDLKQEIACCGPEGSDTEGGLTEVLEVQAHMREEIGSLSCKYRGAVPRHGFTGGGFIKEKRGRDYTRVVATVCPDCGRREVFPPHGERPPRQTWWSDPEKTARQRRERKEKAQLDAERRLRRKERRRPKAEKKERRRMVRDNGDEEATSEIPQEDGAMDAGSEDERRLATNAHRSGEHEESDVSDHQAEEDEEGEPPELSGKVLTSQERLHVKLKEGRIVVQKSFVKGQYPMYRETNWKYAGPCLSCLHSRGPMWILKGMGEKSRNKTKGAGKVKRRDFKLALKGES